MVVACVLLAAMGLSSPASACPFCTALEPTLSQRRDAADVAALGEAVKVGSAGWSFRLHHVLRGDQRLAEAQALDVPAAQAAEAQPQLAAGRLVLLLSEGAGARPRQAWSWVPLNEVSYAYVARSPSGRTPVAERLDYFAPYLEHADPLLANDAYLEFGHAPYDDVTRTAQRMPSNEIRRWLEDEQVPPERKGLYGLLLPLAGGESEQAANAQFLERLILEPASDFRAGFDGLLGGYLVAAPDTALALIERRFFSNPEAAQGDVRHAMTALRFYREYGRDIPADRLARALRPLLERPEFAAAAVADLARFKDWDSLVTVANLFGRPHYGEPATERAIVGYLLACPLPEAARQLERLRIAYPDGVARAEQQLAVFTGDE